MQPASINSQFRSRVSEIRADYRMGKTGRLRPRLTGIAATGSGANYHYQLETHYWYMMELARAYDREDGLVSQGMRRLVDNLMQGGFTLDLAWDNDQLEREFFDDWYDWATNKKLCHNEQRFTWNDMEPLIVRHMLVDGDHWLLPLVDGSLQLVEAHRVRSNHRSTRSNFVHGVERNDDGRPVKVWITSEDMGVQARPKIADFDKPHRNYDDVIHVVDPTRVSQTRGVTIMAPVPDHIGMRSDTEFALLMKVQAASAIAILSQFKNSAPPNPRASQKTASTTADKAPDVPGYYEALEHFLPGIHYRGQKGEEVTAFSARVPSNESMEFSLSIATVIAVNLDLPVQFLLMDGRMTNFSSWRGTLDVAKTSWKCRQSRIDRSLHRPVLHWRLQRKLTLDEDFARRMSNAGLIEDSSPGDGVFRGRAFGDSSVKNQLGHTWGHPRWPYVQPVHDQTARTLAVGHGLTSPRRDAQANGDDFETVQQERIADNAFLVRRAKEAARKINDEFDDGDPVHWRELAMPVTADNLKVSINISDAGETPNASPGEPSAVAAGDSGDAGGEN